MHASLACHVYCACENGHNGASLHVACKCVRSDLVCYIQSINYAHEIQALKQCILRSFWPPSDWVHASRGWYHAQAFFPMRKAYALQGIFKAKL